MREHGNGPVLDKWAGPVTHIPLIWDAGSSGSDKRRSAGNDGAFDKPPPPPKRSSAPVRRGPLRNYPDPWGKGVYWRGGANLVARTRRRVTRANGYALKHGITAYMLPSGRYLPDLNHPLFQKRKWNPLRRDLLCLVGRLAK